MIRLAVIAASFLWLTACFEKETISGWKAANKDHETLALVDIQRDLVNSPKKLSSIDVKKAIAFDINVENQISPLTLIILTGKECSENCEILGYVKNQQDYQKIFSATVNFNNQLPTIIVNQGLVNQMPCFQIELQKNEWLESKQFCYNGQEYALSQQLDIEQAKKF